MNETMDCSASFVLCLLLLLSSFPSNNGDATAPPAIGDTQQVTLTLRADSAIARTEDTFICATLDWWPPTKCNYGNCPWGLSSINNLDLSSAILQNAVKAFGSLRVRIGGSLQDQVVYSMNPAEQNCLDFNHDQILRFGFSNGCLSVGRWNMFHDFVNKTGCNIIFGLNALYGRKRVDHYYSGDWDSSNAREFIQYNFDQKFPIDTWEFGNELCGDGSNPSVVDAKQYGKDLMVLKQMIRDIYNGSAELPKLAAPGGFFAGPWYEEMLKTTGPGVVDIVTHHIYNLGPGNDEGLINKMKDPSKLDGVKDTYNKVLETIKDFGPWSSAWVGESGGAYNSGGKGISNTFVDGFWYLDQLGMVSKLQHKVFCRQALVGGNYALINHTTLIPNPDYYSALLFHRLMGPGVLDATHDGPAHLRAYAHCSKNQPGVTLLLINLAESTTFAISYGGLAKDAQPLQEQREEYHLTPRGGDVQSTVMLLNGQDLRPINETTIPPMDPVIVPASDPLTIAPYSMAFVRMKDFKAQACP